MLRRTEAIVLKSTPFSEADLIVTALSLDYGLLKTFAKSPRKTKSRFGSSLEPLTYSRISFWGREDANLPRMTQSDIIMPFQSIRDDLGSFLMVAEIAELTLSLLPEREPHAGLFCLLRAVLTKIEESIAEYRGDPKGAKGLIERLIVFYKVRFLDMMGYGPALEGCARCNRSGHDFYLSHGAILCGACSQDGDASLRLSPAVIRLYTTLRRWEIGKIGRIRPSHILLNELSGLLNAHLRCTMTRPLKTKVLTL